MGHTADPAVYCSGTGSEQEKKKIENLAKGINFAGTQFFRSRRLSENPNKVCKKVGYAKIKISKKGIFKKIGLRTRFSAKKGNLLIK